MSLVNIRKAAGLGIGLFSVRVILSEVKDLFERKYNFLRFLFPAWTFLRGSVTLSCSHFLRGWNRQWIM